MRMTELDRLLDEHVLARVVAREMQQGDDAASGQRDGNDGQDAQSGVDVGSAMKDLTHRVETRERTPKSLLETGPFTEVETFFCSRRIRAERPLRQRPYNVKLFTRLSNT